MTFTCPACGKFCNREVGTSSAWLDDEFHYCHRCQEAETIRLAKLRHPSNYKKVLEGLQREGGCATNYPGAPPVEYWQSLPGQSEDDWPGESVAGA